MVAGVRHKQIAILIERQTRRIAERGGSPVDGFAQCAVGIEAADHVTVYQKDKAMWVDGQRSDLGETAATQGCDGRFGGVDPGARSVGKPAAPLAPSAKRQK